jgi:monothiol glutaredoxin
MFNLLKLQLALALQFALLSASWAFSVPDVSFGLVRKNELLGSSPTKLSMSTDEAEFVQETPAQTKLRLQEMVDQHPVLLFMKGSKVFPQCGFSNTATQILQSFNIEYHTVDVLADESIRQGVKQFSNWPTIPQLYVAGEFIGGSDIMIEMYQSGELGEMIEKSCAEL